MAQSNGDEEQMLEDHLPLQAALIRELSALPFNKDSSAIFTVDLWVVSDFVLKRELRQRQDRKQHELEARKSEVESIGAVAVDIPELLPILSARLGKIDSELKVLTNSKNGEAL